MTQSIKILCIEDNPVNWRLVQRLLTQAGYSMHWAEEGLKGFEMALELKPDLVLLDINLPGLSGFEVATKFRQHPDLKLTPIVALTAKTLKSDRETALVAGCDGFLPKPIDPFTFVRQVEGYLGGQREHIEKSREGAVLRSFNVQMLEHLESQLKEVQEANSKLTVAQKELELRNQSLSQLLSLGQALLGEHDSAALLIKVLDQVRVASKATQLVAYRLHPSGGYWEGFRWQGAHFEAAPPLARTHAFCSRLYFLSDTGMLQGKALQNHRIWEEGLPLGFWSPNQESCLIVLKDRQAENQIWGFWSFTREGSEPFQPLEVELMALHASLALVSIENAELIHSLQESSRALESSYERMEGAYQDLQSARAELSRQDRRALLDDLFYKITHRLVMPVQTLGHQTLELDRLVAARDTLGDEVCHRAPQAISEMRLAVSEIEGLLKALLRRVNKDDPTTPEWLDLHDLLAQELELLAAEGVVPVGASVETELSAASHRIYGVYGDFGRLLQNLIQHGFGGPTPSPVVRLRSWLDASHFHLEVVDEGGPIPPSEMKAAFEPFNELHQETIIGIRNPGQSLPLCKQLLAAYHGEIELRNEGEGTAVHLHFPLH
ncbi:MAG: response regulator [Holophaga sp.]|nr:response regulator [Holophaga sp.]